MNGLIELSISLSRMMGAAETMHNIEKYLNEQEREGKETILRAYKASYEAKKENYIRAAKEFGQSDECTNNIIKDVEETNNVR